MNTMVYKVFLKSLIIVIGMSGFAALAQNEETEVTISTKGFDDWQLRCEQAKGQAKQCVMTQQALIQNSGQRLMQVNIAKSAEDKTLMTAVLPLGFYLPAGAKLSIGDKAAQDMVVAFCNQGGCYANVTLTSALIRDIGSAEQVVVNIQLQPEQEVGVPISVTGFSDAIKNL